MATMVEVAAVDAIPEGTALCVDVNGTPVAVFHVGGAYYAIGDTCTHEEWSLSEGELVDDHTVECALHGARFDLRTGQAISLPATGNAGSYEVVIEDGIVKVRAPD
jgi:3-phenylpropionate/trans-cinnamate dioxygenase ferredoxin subunit